MSKLTFAFMVQPSTPEHEALVLSKSIRDFAGQHSQDPIWILLPQGAKDIQEEMEQKLSLLNVKVVTFQIDESLPRLPYGRKVFAAAAAEALAQGQTDLLAWMDSDSMVLKEPREFNLEKGKMLGCRPVDIINIGSPYDSPVDPFWEMVYRGCNVPESRLFPMETNVDEAQIKPYINAGLLVVRPENGLLKLWLACFRKLLLDADSEGLRRQSDLHNIFFHQAALTGALLSVLDQKDIQIFSHLVNYPLHLHTEYPAGRRPNFMNEITSCRYWETFSDPSWQSQIFVEEPLKSWLRQQFSQ